MQNTVKLARNLIKYMSVQHIWNLSRLLEVFNCRKLAKLSWNFITTTSKLHPKTTRHKLCCKNLVMMFNSAIGSFLERFVVKIAKCLSLVKKHYTHSSNQHKIDWFLAKFAKKIPTKLVLFLPDSFLAKLAPKISANLSLKIPQTLTFFLRPIRSL